MLSSLILSAFAAPAVTAIEPIPILQVRVEERRCRIESASAEPILLVFASEDRRLVTLEPLPPGAVLEFAFPRRAAAGYLLEAIVPAGYGLVSSGALVLGPRADRTCQSLVFSAGPGGLEAFEDGVRAPIAETLCPAWLALRLTLPAAQESVEMAPLHVPIPRPSDKPPGDSPPDVGDEILPPA